jgi:tRNA A37 threonylcarbamoyladenosine modification protein TsaB
VANDARMNEVYWATFEISNGQLRRLSEDNLNAPEDINTAGFDLYTGSAFQTMLQAPETAQTFTDSHPTAATLLQLAQHEFSNQAQDIIHIQPSYIREKVVFN